MQSKKQVEFATGLNAEKWVRVLFPKEKTGKESNYIDILACWQG